MYIIRKMSNEYVYVSKSAFVTKVDNWIISINV